MLPQSCTQFTFQKRCSPSFWHQSACNLELMLDAFLLVLCKEQCKLSHLCMTVKCLCLHSPDITFHPFIPKPTSLWVSVITTSNSTLHLWYNSFSLFMLKSHCYSQSIFLASLLLLYNSFAIFGVYSVSKFNTVHTFNQCFCLFASSLEIDTHNIAWRDIFERDY